MKVVKGMEVVGVVRDGGPDGPAESLTIRVPKTKQWAFVDAYDERGVLVGAFQQIDADDTPRDALGSIGEYLRNRRTVARISFHEMAQALSYSLARPITAVQVSDMERGRAKLTKTEYLAWLGCLSKLERARERGEAGESI